MRKARIELTESDLFTSKNWTSGDVTVLGLGLGMTWNDVELASKARGFKLSTSVGPGMRGPCRGSGTCDVLDAKGVLTTVSVVFGLSREVKELSIEKLFAGVNPQVEKSHAALGLQGATSRLINQYSRKLRLELLGIETDRKDDRHYGFTTFQYSHRGVSLTVTPCAGKPLEDVCSNIVLSFAPVR